MSTLPPVPPVPPAPTPAPAPAPTPAPSDLLNIQDFAKVQLRVARVLDVRDHPNANKLYLLDVDLGPELGKRQLVAGLKPYQTPEALKGALVVVVANLEPALLRGERSEGMLLAAQDGTQVVPLTVATPVAPGSKIR
jgi:methionine--tRNA ligase beta chain